MVAILFFWNIGSFYGNRLYINERSF